MLVHAVGTVRRRGAASVGGLVSDHARTGSHRDQHPAVEHCLGDDFGPHDLGATGPDDDSPTNDHQTARHHKAADESAARHKQTPAGHDRAGGQLRPVLPGGVHPTGTA